MRTTVNLMSVIEALSAASKLEKHCWHLSRLRQQELDGKELGPLSPSLIFYFFTFCQICWHSKNDFWWDERNRCLQSNFINERVYQLVLAHALANTHTCTHAHTLTHKQTFMNTPTNIHAHYVSRFFSFQFSLTHSHNHTKALLNLTPVHIISLYNAHSPLKTSKLLSLDTRTHSTTYIRIYSRTYTCVHTTIACIQAHTYRQHTLLSFQVFQWCCFHSSAIGKISVFCASWLGLIILPRIPIWRFSLSNIVIKVSNLMVSIQEQWRLLRISQVLKALRSFFSLWRAVPSAKKIFSRQRPFQLNLHLNWSPKASPSFFE